MREIIFKGKRLNNGEWVEGSLCISDSKVFVVYDNDFYVTKAVWLGDCLVSDRFFEVDPETVGQFTGLKDKNALINVYECDIINVNGLVGGNIYENGDLLKERSNFAIPSITSKDWHTAYKKAMDRGCRHAE